MLIGGSYINLLRRICTVFIVTLLLAGLQGGTSAAQDLSGLSIAIDAGHGINSANEGPTGLKEYDANMKVARFLEAFLYSANIDTVILTQTENRREPGLSVREDIANSNGVDWFHSIHHNAFNGAARYTVVIYQEIIGQNRPRWPEVLQMCNLMSPNIQGALRTSSWYVRSDYDIRGFNFGVLNDLIMPGQLSEGTFHDNAEEEKKLRNPDFLKLEALAIYKSLRHYFEGGNLDVAPLGGIIRDEENKKPIDGATVRIIESGQEYQTDDHGNGIYAYAELTANEYVLEASASGYQAELDTIEIEDNKFNFLDFSLAPKTLPVVGNSQPAYGDSLVSPYGWFEIEFSREMNPQSVEAALRIEPGFPYSLRWFSQNQKIRIDPHPVLQFNRRYTLIIDTVAVDIYGNPIAGDTNESGPRSFILQFTTSLIDFSRPQILATHPVDLQSNVQAGDLIRVDFNKALDPTTLTPENIILLGRNQRRIGTLVHQTVTQGGRGSLTIAPETPFESNLRYTVTLRKSILDSNSVEMDNHFQFRFNTEDTDRRHIILDAFNSGLNNWGNPADSELSFGFDANFSGISISNAPVLRDSGSVMKIDFQFVGDGVIDVRYQGGQQTFLSEDIVGMYVYGDSSNSLIRFYFLDLGGGLEAGPWHKVDWTGWKMISSQPGVDSLVALEDGDGYVDGEFSLAGFQVAGTPENGGTVYIEDLFASTTLTTSVGQDVPTIPEDHLLIQSFPNPFSRNAGHSGIAISYEIPPHLDKAKVNLSIYNTLGQRILELVSENQSAGLQQISWNVLDELGLILPAGVYFYRLQVGNLKKTQRLVILN
jgi:N-acetylmuramoyl-L-alanine amidase